MRETLLSVALLLTTVTAAAAQSESAAGVFIRTIGNDFRHVVSVDNGLILAGAGGLAAGVAPHERAIVRLATRADGMDDLFNTAPPLGHGLTQIGGATALLMAGRLTHHPRVDVLGRRLLRAQVLNGTITQSLKFAVRRRRPDGGARSFPSGHTSAAFATATVLQGELGWKVGAPSFVIASYIGTARVAANKHYVSDLIVGAAIGLVSGRAVRTVSRSRTVTIVPIVGNNAAGMLLTWNSRS